MKGTQAHPPPGSGLVKGNPGPASAPLRRTSPQPDPRIPPRCRPGSMPGPAEEWTRVTEELAAVDLISELDMAMLAKYCAAYADVGRAPGADRAGRGWFVPTADGGRKRHPGGGKPERGLDPADVRGGWSSG